MKLNKDSAKALERVFSLLDKDGNGALEPKDLVLQHGIIKMDKITMTWAKFTKHFEGDSITPEVFVEGMSELALSRPISAAHVKPSEKTSNSQLMAAAEASF